MKDRVCHPRICQRRTGYVTPLTINRRQPNKKWIYKETTLEKTINWRQPGKKQTDKETTLETTINGRQPDKKTDKQ
jgi:hypothetical protein